MIRCCRWLLLSSLVWVACQPAVQATGLEDLGWVAGTWKRETSRGSLAYETWRVLSDRTFEGEAYGLTESGERVVFETLLLVEMGGQVFYMPKIADNPYPVAFKLVSIDAGTAVFENPDHDFPQKIEYARKGKDRLHVTASGPVAGQDEPRRLEFHFTRAK